MVILVNHIDVHRFRNKRLGLRRGPQGDPDLMAQTHFGRSLGGHPTIHQSITVLDHLLQKTTRKLWDQLCDNPIQSLPMQRSWNTNLSDLLDVFKEAIRIVQCVNRIVDFGVGRYNQSVQQFQGVTDAKLQIIDGSGQSFIGYGTLSDWLRQQSQRPDHGMDA
jgi:hypothetical protein